MNDNKESIDDLITIENMNSDTIQKMVEYRALTMISYNPDDLPLIELREAYQTEFKVDEDTFWEYYTCVDKFYSSNVLKEVK